MEIKVRDLTIGVDFSINLPTIPENLRKSLKENHEYIIIDHDGILHPGEFSNIYELNEFLLYCKANDIDDNTLRILSKAYWYEEVLDAVREKTYVIVDFTEETRHWYNENGGNYSDDSDLGLCLFDNGFIELPFEYTEEMEDYIKWDCLWRNAEYTGWRRLIIDYNCYLVKTT